MDFGIRNPRIAVLGLNPHAGDDGLLGSEEQEVISPAIEKAKETGITALGPYAADGFFGAGRFRRFDAVLAMYHDQGLAPFKSLSMDNGSELYCRSAGGQNQSGPWHSLSNWPAKIRHLPTSFRNAIYLAIDVARNRKLYEEISANPLVAGQYKERREG